VWDWYAAPPLGNRLPEQWSNLERNRSVFEREKQSADHSHTPLETDAPSLATGRPHMQISAKKKIMNQIKRGNGKHPVTEFCFGGSPFAWGKKGARGGLETVSKQSDQHLRRQKSPEDGPRRSWGRRRARRRKSSESRLPVNQQQLEDLMPRALAGNSSATKP